MSEHVFTPENKLTFDTISNDNVRLLAQLKNQAVSHVTLDLSKVIQCDSAGLALLVEAKRLALVHHKTIAFTGMPKVIEALANFCGVESILNSEKGDASWIN